LQPDNVDAWYGLGNAYLELGRQQTRHLAEIAPDGAQLWRLAGDLWQLRSDSAKARLLYEEANRRKSSVNEDSAYQAATEFRQKSQSAFERLAAIAPNSHRAHQVIAESLVAQRRTSEAIDEYRTVLKLKPDLAGIRSEIGGLLMSEGKAAEALQEFRSELRNRPNDPALHYRLGRALAITGEDKAAEEALRAALKLGPAPPGVLKELAKLQIRRGLHGQATESLTKYVQSVPNDASAHYLLMRAYSALGDSSSAARHRTKFQELSDHEKKRASLQEALSFFHRKEEPPE
jgi:Tfp pilus assembly protein PilF